MAVLNGTAGNDAFVAHSSVDYQKGQLILVLGGMPAAGEWPRPNILINGQWAASFTITAPVLQGQTQVVAVDLPDGPITSVGIQFWNDLRTASGEDRNLYVGSATLNGVQLPISQASYALDGDATIPGQHDMGRNGTLTWSGSAVSNAMAQSRVPENNEINGGAGMDTVIYTGRERGTFDFKYVPDGSLTVHHWMSGFTDVIRGVENVLFDDRGTYGGGGSANVDAAGRTIDGGAGIDTLVLNGHRDQYYINHTATGFTIFGNGVDQWVTNVERLKFTNGYVALDIEGHGGQAYRLYQAAFDRVPDIPGVGYQTNELDTKLTLVQVAANFIASPEFQTTYGSVDNRQFVTLLYRNVLDREPEQAGLEYHMNRLANGATRADILVGFSESPENKANVIGAIDDGFFYTLT